MQHYCRKLYNTLTINIQRLKYKICYLKKKWGYHWKSKTQKRMMRYWEVNCHFGPVFSVWQVWKWHVWEWQVYFKISKSKLVTLKLVIFKLVISKLVTPKIQDNCLVWHCECVIIFSKMWRKSCNIINVKNGIIRKLRTHVTQLHFF